MFHNVQVKAFVNGFAFDLRFRLYGVVQSDKIDQVQGHIHFWMTLLICQKLYPKKLNFWKNIFLLLTNLNQLNLLTEIIKTFIKVCKSTNFDQFISKLYLSFKNYALSIVYQFDKTLQTCQQLAPPIDSNMN